eukprot:TRINITY_DN8091_c0_g1_i1.p1 TRINITY_DN8091_c0_g1~~TRINITY_DN8091_c0_g1_i1.p1  ORF type:complete len:444 (-),score=113.32 TRINITY_DN8091_c0_g1_i1:1241-2572(-)
MASSTPASVNNFFIFTPKDTREGEEYKKVMFFWPETIPIGEQTRHIGLSAALVNFTSKFSPEQPCEAVHMEKKTLAFYGPEPEFWIVMSVNNPSVVKVRDGKSVLVSKENELDDIALKTVIIQAYKTFKLFYGSFESIQSQTSEENLKAKLQSFFGQYVPALRFDQVDLFNTLEGIHFLPVDKNVYLRIQCFINLTENTYPKIKNSCFFYSDHLVWSGLEQEDMKILCRYLVHNLIPALSDKVKPPYFESNRTNNGFITGPENLTQKDCKINLPIVHIGPQDEKHVLIIYKMEDIILFFVAEPTANDFAFFKSLGAFINDQLEFLVPILNDHYQKKQNAEESYRYIYFNHMNCALKTPLKEKGSTIPRETMKMLNDIHADFEKSPEKVSEMLIRTQNDRWVVGKKSDQRELYVIFDHKNSHLIEINDEVRKLCNTYFSNIFMD